MGPCSRSLNSTLLQEWYLPFWFTAAFVSIFSIFSTCSYLFTTWKRNFLQQGLLCGFVCEHGFHIFDTTGSKVIEVAFLWSTLTQNFRLLLVTSPKSLTSVVVLLQCSGNRCVLFLRYISTTEPAEEPTHRFLKGELTVCHLSSVSSWLEPLHCMNAYNPLSSTGENSRGDGNFFSFSYTSLLLRGIFILFIK